MKLLIDVNQLLWNGPIPVSYTHLDVYKRQIPQVSGEVRGYLDQSFWRVVLAKFTGGTLSIFGGLSLGREGPSIQLGAMAVSYTHLCFNHA